MQPQPAVPGYHATRSRCAAQPGSNAPGIHVKVECPAQTIRDSSRAANRRPPTAERSVPGLRAKFRTSAPVLHRFLSSALFIPFCGLLEQWTVWIDAANRRQVIHYTIHDVLDQNIIFEVGHLPTICSALHRQVERATQARYFNFR